MATRKPQPVDDGQPGQQQPYAAAATTTPTRKRPAKPHRKAPPPRRAAPPVVDEVDDGFDPPPTASVARGDTSRQHRLTRPGNATRDARFEVDHSRIPAGMVMEWKRVTLRGMDDRRNQIITAQNHWEPVTHEMQPHILAQFGSKGAPIIVDDQQLYMRPAYLCEDADAEFRGETKRQLRNQLQSLKMSSKDQVGEKNTTVNRKFEPIVGTQSAREIAV